MDPELANRRFSRLGVSTRHAPGWKDRQWNSRVLHRLGEVTARPAVGLLALVLALAWVLVGVAVGFPSWWATTLYTVTGSVTFVMVFVIQHTHARQTSATQLKLDELIRASTRADNALIAVEESSEAHLLELTELTLEAREWL
jgi:low affinity Fe/Cu permease